MNDWACMRPSTISHSLHFTVRYLTLLEPPTVPGFGSSLGISFSFAISLHSFGFFWLGLWALLYQYSV